MPIEQRQAKSNNARQAQYQGKLRSLYRRLNEKGMVLMEWYSNNRSRLEDRSDLANLLIEQFSLFKGFSYEYRPEFALRALDCIIEKLYQEEGIENPFKE